MEPWQDLSLPQLLADSELKVCSAFHNVTRALLLVNSLGALNDRTPPACRARRPPVFEPNFPRHWMDHRPGLGYRAER